MTEHIKEEGCRRVLQAYAYQDPRSAHVSAPVALLTFTSGFPSSHRPHFPSQSRSDKQQFQDLDLTEVTKSDLNLIPHVKLLESFTATEGTLSSLRESMRT
eukprot:m.329114 g.329114  ORF g.329114 m.329114 type:complete len:101 (+) comp16502_c1_seq65:552-854(+)